MQNPLFLLIEMNEKSLSSGAPVYLPDYNQFTQAVTRSSAYKISKIAFLLKDATESYVKEIVAYAWDMQFIAALIVSGRTCQQA